MRADRLRDARISATLARMTKGEDQKSMSAAMVVLIMFGVTLGATLLMSLWGACWVTTHVAIDQNPYAVPGSFGDAFAPVVGLLTSIALSAAIASVFMQRKELELQRDEMKEARKQWTDQAAALKDANTLQKRANDLNGTRAATRDPEADVRPGYCRGQHDLLGEGTNEGHAS